MNAVSGSITVKDTSCALELSRLATLEVIRVLLYRYLMSDLTRKEYISGLIIYCERLMSSLYVFLTRGITLSCDGGFGASANTGISVSAMLFGPLSSLSHDSAEPESGTGDVGTNSTPSSGEIVVTTKTSSPLETLFGAEKHWPEINKMQSQPKRAFETTCVRDILLIKRGTCMDYNFNCSIICNTECLPRRSVS